MTESATGIPEATRHATQGSPLAVGLVGFGIGLVAAALVPASEREQELAQRIEPGGATTREEAGGVVRQQVDEMAPEVSPQPKT